MTQKLMQQEIQLLLFKAEKGKLDENVVTMETGLHKDAPEEKFVVKKTYEKKDMTEILKTLKLPKDKDKESTKSKQKKPSNKEVKKPKARVTSKKLRDKK